MWSLFAAFVGLASAQYVPPLPPPRVYTHTEIRFETRYQYQPIVVAVGSSWAAPPPAAAVHTGAAAPPPETIESRCAKGDLDACHQQAAGFYWDGDRTRALEMLSKLCDQGQARSCTAAAAVTTKPAEIESFLQRGCDGGYDACAELGFRLLDGVGGSAVDEPRAARLFERACASGSADGCIGLGWLHWLGKAGYAYDPKAAVAYGERACPDATNGKPLPCLELARFHEWNGDRAAANNVRLDLCYRSGIPGEQVAEACRLVGPVLYHGGDGIVADRLGALAAYDRACKYDGESCYRAAGLAKQIPGHREPTELASRSCERGYAQGCTLLGDLLQEAPPSYEVSLNERFAAVAAARRRGCDLGDPIACAHTGMAGASPQEQADLEKGCAGGVAAACSRAAEMIRDPARVVAMHEKACATGLGAACVTVGDMYQRGAGVSAAADKAISWFARGCAGGDRLGCVRAADALLEGRGTAADPAAADRRYTELCDAHVGAACVALADAIEAGKLPVDGRDVVGLRRRGCLGGVRAACDAVPNLGPTWAPDTLVFRFTDETFASSETCQAAGPLLWVGGARWSGTLKCGGGVTSNVEGALLQPLMEWPSRTPVRVLAAKDAKGTWAHVGMSCRTGDRAGHVFCMDGKEYFLHGTVFEPVAAELVQLPPRKPIRAGKRLKVKVGEPVVEHMYTAECVAMEELRWTPEGWYEGKVKCEDPDTVFERVGLQTR